MFEGFSEREKVTIWFVNVWIGDRTALVIRDIPAKKILIHIQSPNLTLTSTFYV